MKAVVMFLLFSAFGLMTTFLRLKISRVIVKVWNKREMKASHDRQTDSL